MAEVRDVLNEAAHAAGSIILEYFQGSFRIEKKDSVNNLVTEVDKLSEKVIIDIIKKYFPDHSIISEEVGELMQDSDYQWIIDPIDGTVNFAHGIPICCVSIGVRYKNEMLYGVVYNPMMDEFFFAEKDNGAYLNDEPISVSEKSDFETACLVTGFPYKWPVSKEHPIRVFERFIMQGLPVRRLGSAAIDLCWVACGRFDGFWEYNLNSWDVAAGYLIVQEAGGKITNFQGEQYSVFDKETLATNGLIHDEMLRLITVHE
ncbi:inositol monophosphatase family protein [Taibaiella soli]|uniref:Inositol-1-monophosphatase n=1 Tax=Taibaiella soli TaxID=1649169 RepID=A0A2W2B424_9BACT|nr:inositol monophosphatase family protein [Taibaiella soli]PZF70999.1 inositol monophosphatase [Taibaiella soli]